MKHVNIWNFADKEQTNPDAIQSIASCGNEFRTLVYVHKTDTRIWMVEEPYQETIPILKCFQVVTGVKLN
jgi:hypothetical protein